MPRAYGESISLSPEAIDAVLRLGGPALLRRLVRVAAANLGHRLEQLGEALACSPPDLAGAERAAHSIKSSSAYLGAEELRRLAADIEASARDEQMDGLEAKLHRAHALLERTLPVLEAEVQRHDV